jgi:serine/threonine-protein kinase
MSGNSHILSDGRDCTRLVQCTESFRTAWGRLGHDELLWPHLMDFLPAKDEAGDLWQVIAATLAVIDLESRLKRGAAVRVEDYLESLPELQSWSTAIRDLIKAEYECILFQGHDLDPATYKDRFPTIVVDDLLRELRDLRDEPENDPNGPRFQPIVLHGQGGFGEVFLAFDRELKRCVALKEVRLDRDEGHDGGECRTRLIREAHLAGGLQHPAVVPIYSLGRYEDGRPYYAMPFLPGNNLKRSIEVLHAPETSRRLAGWEPRLRSLIRRFLDVCNGIAYAHSRGVLHCDLKPDNIILGSFGETILIDWGLAERVSSPHEGPTPRPVGTLHYMSPEQLRGEPLAATSDVYNLGATLYSILTGRLPYEDLDEHVLRDPDRRGRCTPPRKIAGRVPWALQAICLKAISPRPADRYHDAKELAQDVDRWLSDERVSAAREPLAHRGQRLLRRHAREIWGIAAGAFVLIPILTFLWASNWRLNWKLVAANQRLRAANQALQQRTALTLDALRNYSEVVGRDEFLKQPSPEMDRLRRKLLSTPLPYLERLKEQFDSSVDTDPNTRASLAEAYLSLASITSQVGSKEEATEGYTRAFAIAKALVDTDRSDPRYRQDLARAAHELGTLLGEVCRMDEAVRHLGEAVDLGSELLSEDSHKAVYRRDLARASGDLGVLHRDMGHPIEALACFERAIELLKGQAKTAPDEVELRGELARTLNNLGRLQLNIGQRNNARVSLREAADLNSWLVEKAPTTARFRNQHGRTHFNLSSLEAAEEKWEAALRHIEQACSIQKRLTDEYPAFTQAWADLASAYGNRGNLERARHDYEGAETSFGKAHTILEKLVAENPAVDAFQNDLASFYNSYGALQADTDRKQETLGSFEKAREIRTKLVDGRCVLPLIRRNLAETEFNIGLYLFGVGRPDEASKSFEQARQRLESLVRDLPGDLDLRSLLGRTIDGLSLATLRPDRVGESVKLAEVATPYHQECVRKAPDVEPYRTSLRNHERILAELRKAWDQRSVDRHDP